MTDPVAIGGEPTDSRQRIMVLAGIGAGLLLVAFLASTFLFGGSDGTAIDDGIPSPSERGTPPVTSPPSDEPEPIETFEIFSTKNPFLPNLPATITTEGTTPDGSGTTPTSDAGASGGGATEPQQTQRVALLEIFDDEGTPTANVRVDDTVVTVMAGDTFATSYRVVSLGETCGQFLFGDNPFELCVGEEILK
ncbi:MAG TPA: hypothetical protein VGA13_04630 [Acidimicrobiales bacterium]|jgi:hypothetical protein